MWLALQITELLLRNRASVNKAKYFRAPCRKTMRWIKNVPYLLDGLDEFYHCAKFGKGRTKRAGCRCVIVVFVFVLFCLFFSSRMPRSGKLPVLHLLTGQKSGFTPHRGDSLHRFTSNLAGPTGTFVCLAV